jgi:hypothetical protein
MTSRIMLTVLAGLLAACSENTSPLAPEAAGSPLLSQGGAPSPIAEGPIVDEFASAICGFTVLTEFAGKVKVLEFPNGKAIIIFPGYTQTWTNENTARSVTRSLTGSFHINPLPNGETEIVFTGNNAIGRLDVEGSEDFLVFTSGRFTEVVAPDGSLVQALEGNGRRVDVCPLLA